MINYNYQTIESIVNYLRPSTIWYVNVYIIFPCN